MIENRAPADLPESNKQEEAPKRRAIAAIAVWTVVYLALAAISAKLGLNEDMTFAKVAYWALAVAMAWFAIDEAAFGVKTLKNAK